MNTQKLVNNPFRHNPNFKQARETIKVNRLGKTNYCTTIRSQVKGLFLLRHSIGLNNAISRLKTFKLCKKMLDYEYKAN